MKIVEVSSKLTIQKFHDLPFLIYKNDPNWIPHIQQEVDVVFDPKKNKYFKTGSAIRFLLEDSTGVVIGRVAAFIDGKRANTFKQATGGMGFFECIESEEAANILFDACKKWLSERDMEAMDGPINFGEKDRYWGLLVSGFNHPPIYANSYNPPYYQAFFENYGFQTYFNQHNFIRPLTIELPERYIKRYDRINKNEDYSLELINKKNLKKYADDFREIYNAAWVTHDNFKGMSEDQAMSMLRKIKPVMEEDLVWFAYFKGKPIAFLIMLPELNQFFKVVNGNFNLWGKLKFLFRKLFSKPSFVWGLAFGVTPKFQGLGMESYVLNSAADYLRTKKPNYKDVIVTWIGDFNPKMIHVTKSMGAKNYHDLKTYRKLFDEKAVFERSPIIE
jgi:GNAT superfamily N-acetyltransferase